MVHGVVTETTVSQWAPASLPALAASPAACGSISQGHRQGPGCFRNWPFLLHALSRPSHARTRVLLDHPLCHPVHHRWGLGLRLFWALPLSRSHLTRHIQLPCALVSSPVKGPVMVPRGAWVLSTPLWTFPLQPPPPPCTKSPRGWRQSEGHPPPASMPTSPCYSAFLGSIYVPPKFTSAWNLRVGCYLEIGPLQL